MTELPANFSHVGLAGRNKPAGGTDTLLTLVSHAARR
jgi:hypothetical protein